VIAKTKNSIRKGSWFFGG